MFDNSDDFRQINDAMNQTQSVVQRIWQLVKFPFRVIGAIYRSTQKVFRVLEKRKDRDTLTSSPHKVNHDAQGKSVEQMGRNQKQDFQVRKFNQGINHIDPFGIALGSSFSNVPRNRRFSEITANAVAKSAARNNHKNLNIGPRQKNMEATL